MRTNKQNRALIKPLLQWLIDNAYNLEEKQLAEDLIKAVQHYQQDLEKILEHGKLNSK